MLKVLFRVGLGAAERGNDEGKLMDGITTREEGLSTCEEQGGM